VVTGRLTDPAQTPMWAEAARLGIPIDVNQPQSGYDAAVAPGLARIVALHSLPFIHFTPDPRTRSVPLCTETTMRPNPKPEFHRADPESRSTLRLL
jgi:hypothetical protein